MTMQPEIYIHVSPLGEVLIHIGKYLMEFIGNEMNNELTPSDSEYHDHHMQCLVIGGGVFFCIVFVLITLTKNFLDFVFRDYLD